MPVRVHLPVRAHLAPVRAQLTSTAAHTMPTSCAHGSHWLRTRGPTAAQTTPVSAQLTWLPAHPTLATEDRTPVTAHPTLLTTSCAKTKASLQKQMHWQVQRLVQKHVYVAQDAVTRKLRNGIT